MPLSHQGAAHLSTSDDLYNGYHIPANSIVIANQWQEHPLSQLLDF